ncbi:hypothetical protein V6N12_062729 [Hibiscus sabdariffa]|uniref:Uncharacterized protein n=1 Tax=Hibiscus sabdariffa TaxID=183260 RepID=A0ABR2F9Z5_9ROSI
MRGLAATRSGTLAAQWLRNKVAPSPSAIAFGAVLLSRMRGLIATRSGALAAQWLRNKVVPSPSAIAFGAVVSA